MWLCAGSGGEWELGPGGAVDIPVIRAGPKAEPRNPGDLPTQPQDPGVKIRQSRAGKTNNSIRLSLVYSMSQGWAEPPHLTWWAYGLGWVVYVFWLYLVENICGSLPGSLALSSNQRHIHNSRQRVMQLFAGSVQQCWNVIYFMRPAW